MTAGGDANGKSIAAVIVTFEPDEQVRETIAAIASQVGMTIVVDNSSSVDAQRLVAAACHAYGCRLVTNGTNLGIAEALNRGVQAAKENGASHVLTMDQDSTAMPGMARELERVLDATQHAGYDVGCVAASGVDANTGVSIAAPVSDNDWSELRLAITSGSLLPMSVFRRCGLFRPEYFIDSVDQEFCLRIRQHGYHIVRAHRAALRHRLGHPTVHCILGKRFIPTNHSTPRRFYMARNVLWTARLFLFTETRTVTVLVLKLLKNTLLIALFEREKWAKLLAIATGLRQGVTTSPSAIQVLS